VLSVDVYSESRDSIAELQDTVTTLRDRGEYEAASQIQKKIVNRSVRDESQMSLINSYYNLGVVEFETGDFLASRLAFEKSIEISKSFYGPMHESAIRGLTFLGLVLLREQFLDSALQQFYEAQHIMHRSYGVRTIQQERLLDWMTQIHLKQNNFKVADKLQRLNYITYQSSYGQADRRTVPAMIKLGRWFQSSAQYTDSIKLFEGAIKTIENEKLSSETLKQALTELAETYYLTGKCCAGELMAKAAYAIEESSDHDLVDKRLAFLRAADMSLFMPDEETGRKLYEAAARFSNQMGENLMDEKLLEEKGTTTQPHILGISRIDRMVLAYRPDLKRKKTIHRASDESSKAPPPVKLVGAPVPMCAAEIEGISKNSDYSKYVIDMDFDVTMAGRAKNIKIVSSNAPNAVNRLFRRIVHHYRFRPGMNKGKPALERMSLQQTFGETTKGETSGPQPFAIGNIAAIHGCHLLASI